jgi:hypothetical protein
MTKKLLKIVPLLQTAALASDNLEFQEKKKKKTKDFLKQGVKNMVAIPLISETANFVESF